MQRGNLPKGKCKTVSLSFFANISDAVMISSHRAISCIFRTDTVGLFNSFKIQRKSVVVSLLIFCYSVN